MVMVGVVVLVELEKNNLIIHPVCMNVPRISTTPTSSTHLSYLTLHILHNEPIDKMVVDECILEDYWVENNIPRCSLG